MDKSKHSEILESIQGLIDIGVLSKKILTGLSLEEAERREKLKAKPEEKEDDKKSD